MGLNISLWGIFLFMNLHYVPSSGMVTGGSGNITADAHGFTDLNKKNYAPEVIEYSGDDSVFNTAHYVVIFIKKYLKKNMLWIQYSTRNTDMGLVGARGLGVLHEWIISEKFEQARMLRILDILHTIWGKLFFAWAVNQGVCLPATNSGKLELILGLCTATERDRYNVTPSLTGWEQT